MVRRLAAVLALTMLAGCAVDAGTDDSNLEEDGATSSEEALGAARHTIKANVDLGGGVIVANRPGGFYMGRLLVGQTFDREGRWYLSNENGTSYAWGMAWGHSDACLWIGPSRGKSGFTAGTWATSGRPDGSGRCNAAKKDWLVAGDARNLASHFNCPPPTASAHGTEKKLLRDAALYWNVAWTGGPMGYDGGELRDVVKTLPKGTSVWYRYTTRDGKRVVAFVPGVGWGFFESGAIDRTRTGTWSFPETPGTLHEC